MDESMPSALYTALDPPSRQIRLLKILPGRDASQICCSLTSYDLYQPMCVSGSSPKTWGYTPRDRLASDFTCLSYAWGEPSEGYQISLNDHDVCIRPNLWYFLREASMCTEYQHRLFWIDSLCIDQSNNTERMHQVGRMAQIYRRAKEVLLWLGPASESSDLGVDLLSSSSLIDLALYRTQEHNVQAILDLCERSYWSRLWVLQELINAKEATVVCGRGALSLNSFTIAVQEFTRLDPNDSRSPGTAALLDSPAVSMLRQARTRRPSLWDLIMTTTHLGCTEIRDRVYALLNIVEEGHENIGPDYAMSMSGLLNAVLKNEYRLRPPSSLSKALLQAAELEKALEVESGTAFAMDESVNGLKVCIERYPLTHPGTHATFWWSVVHRHHEIASLWLSEGDLPEAAEALLFAASQNYDELCALILQEPSTKNALDKIPKHRQPLSAKLLGFAMTRGTTLLAASSDKVTHVDMDVCAVRDLDWMLNPKANPRPPQADYHRFMHCLSPPLRCMPQQLVQEGIFDGVIPTVSNNIQLDCLGLLLFTSLSRGDEVTANLLLKSSTTNVPFRGDYLIPCIFAAAKHRFDDITGMILEKAGTHYSSSSKQFLSLLAASIAVLNGARPRTLLPFQEHLQAKTSSEWLQMQADAIGDPMFRCHEALVRMLVGKFHHGLNTCGIVTAVSKPRHQEWLHVTEDIDARLVCSNELDTVDKILDSYVYMLESSVKMLRLLVSHAGAAIQEGRFGLARTHPQYPQELRNNSPRGV